MTNPALPLPSPRPARIHPGPARRVHRTAAAVLLTVAATVLTATGAAAGPPPPAFAATAAGPAPAAMPWTDTISAATGTGTSVAVLSAAAPARTTGDPSGARYSTGRASSTVGQLLDKRGGACTATVIGSSSGRIAVTAAHCVYIPRTRVLTDRYQDGQPTGWIPLEEFVPGRVGDTAPFGVWPIDRAWVDSRWQQSGDPRYDIAFIRLGVLDGATAQAALGSQPIRFNAPALGKPTTVLGFPTEAPFDGLSMRRCTNAATTGSTVVPGALLMPCALTPGSSGGPWMTGFNATSGVGTVVAVTSFLPYGRMNQLAAIPLGASAEQLYRNADINR